MTAALLIAAAIPPLLLFAHLLVWGADQPARDNDGALASLAGIIGIAATGAALVGLLTIYG